MLPPEKQPFGAELSAARWEMYVRVLAGGIVLLLCV